MKTLRPLLALVVALALLSLAGSALADANVVVEVRSAAGEEAEGVVTLTPRGQGEALSCTLRVGSCRIVGVPGGRYVVTFAPAEGQPPAPRNVMIPPSGEVRLSVSTR